MKVVVCEGNGLTFVESVLLAAQKSEFDVVYWTAYNFRRKTVAEAFPEAVFHDTAYAIRALSPGGSDDMSEAMVDAGLLRALAPYETIFMQMLDRCDPDGRSFTHRERLRMFHKLVRQWKGIIEIHKPDLVIHPETPHMFFDFVAYALCQHLDIPSLWFDRTAFPGRMLKTSHHRQGSDLITAALQAHRAHEPPPLLPEYMALELVRLRSSGKESTSANMRKKISDGIFVTADTPRARLIHALRRELGSLWSTGRKTGFRAWAPRNYIKKSGVRMEESWHKLPTWGLERLKGIFKKHELRAEYDSLVKKPDINCPFVFLSLQNQPERMTCPLAEGYEQQHTYVKLVAKMLPTGWKLFVKEHPWQLSSAAIRGHMSRWAGYYKELAAIKGVELIPLDYPSYQLIDASKGCAVLTGSLGFQSVVRGKPVLVGGYPWYRDIEGAFPGDCEIGCKKFFEAIVNGYIPDNRGVEAFISALDEVASRVWTEEGREDRGDVTVEECRENMANAIVGVVENLAEKSNNLAN